MSPAPLRPTAAREAAPQPAPPAQPARYLTNDEAAAYLRLSPRTLEKQRVIGGGPRFRKFGRRVMYAVEGLQGAQVQERCSTRANGTDGNLTCIGKIEPAQLDGGGAPPSLKIGTGPHGVGKGLAVLKRGGDREAQNVLRQLGRQDQPLSVVSQISIAR